MRQLVLDTETTGIDPATGDRVIEVAAIEIVNLVPTGRRFHTLLDPERDVPEEVVRVHGFTRAHLTGKPRFADVAPALLDFLGDAPIIAHNAVFDFGFLDHELRLAGHPCLDRARLVCSLELARRRFPGLPNSLDALCRRFGIDLSQRTTHNALLDVKLLAEVYLELMGGRQTALGLVAGTRVPVAIGVAAARSRTPRPIVPSAAELEAHAGFLARLRDPLWLHRDAAT